MKSYFLVDKKVFFYCSWNFSSFVCNIKNFVSEFINKKKKEKRETKGNKKEFQSRNY